jgi:hypothetical protein
MQLCVARPECKFVAYVIDNILRLNSSKYVNAFKSYERNSGRNRHFCLLLLGFFHTFWTRLKILPIFKLALLFVLPVILRCHSLKSGEFYESYRSDRQTHRRASFPPLTEKRMNRIFSSRSFRGIMEKGPLSYASKLLQSCTK